MEGAAGGNQGVSLRGPWREMLLQGQGGGWGWGGGSRWRPRRKPSRSETPR